VTEIPEVRYTETPDGSWIAYQVIGSGDTDVVFVPGWVSNLDLIWDQRHIGAFLRQVAERSRLIVFDRRGCGLSDRPDVPSIDLLMDDVRAVMDATGSEKAVLVGVTMGGAMASVFAATFPERTRGLVLIQCAARVAWAPDYPLGETEEYHRDETARIAAGWGSGGFERWFLDGMPEGRDEAYVAEVARYLRNSMSRGSAARHNETWFQIDYRHVLPAIHVPTVVIERHQDIRDGALIAERIPGAQLLHLPDEPTMPWVPGSTRTVEALARFIDQIRDEEADLERVLATVLLTDIVDSTAAAAEMGDRRWREGLAEHDRIVRGLIARHRGREIKTMGDGFLATFDGPARAVRCAAAARTAVRLLEIDIRAGLHTGEIEMLGEDVGGIAVAITARIGAMAGPGEVLVSSTVKDLVAGSGLVFEDTGEHELKGVPDRWKLYRVVG